jgi:hypothetical protein
MNKLTKILFSAITSVMLVTSAFAGEFAVTGGVKTTYTILSNSGTVGTHGVGKGIGLSNEFSLSASGELDNGMTWSYAQDIDGATVQDDANLAIGTDYGTFKVCISECGLSTKYSFDNSAYGVGSDNGYGGGAAAGTTMQYGSNISSYNNVQYHAPADILPFSLTFKAASTVGGAGGTANDSSHSVVGTKTVGDMTQYAVTMAPIDGLSLAASYYIMDAAGNIGARQENEGGSYSANYSMGPVSLGYGETLHAPSQRMSTASTTAKTNYYDNNAFSLGFAVNDALSVSYTEENSEKKTKATSVANAVTRTAVEMEIETIDLAYTVGGMTLSVSNSETKNASYIEGDDVTETIVAMSMAF